MPGVPTPMPAGVPVRRLTLNEAFDEYGRLIQFLGTDVAGPPTRAAPGSAARTIDAPTEIIAAGSTEVWEIVNLTGDTHPIHFHLVNVQVLSRQAFDVDALRGRRARAYRAGRSPRTPTSSAGRRRCG